MVFPARHSRRIVPLLSATLLLGLAAGLGLYLYRPVPPAPVEPPARGLADERPAAEPAEAPDSPPPITSYIDLVRLLHPELAQSDPLGSPVALEEATRIVLDYPVYLCSRGDLWITHPNAPPLEQVLVEAPAEQSHLTSDLLLYVHWLPGAGGQWRPLAVTARGQSLLAIDGDTRIELPARQWRWDRAQSWNRPLIVPAAGGISVLDFPAEGVVEQHHALSQGGEAYFLLDRRGILAWSPWEDGRPGSNGAARYVDGEWIELSPRDGWPQRIIHLVPLLDGSVLAIAQDSDGPGGTLHMLALDVPDIDEEQVLQLVDQLSDLDPQRRQDAYEQLTRYGTALWPIIEQIIDAQPAEARFRLRELLRSRISPTIGGMSLVSGDLRVASRLGDGGVLLYSDAGVTRAASRGSVRETVTPAWLSLRPGRPARLLPPAMVQELVLGRTHVAAFGNEWIISDEAHGPRRFLGNHFVALLPQQQHHFGRLVGIDRRGRWLFRQAADHPQTLLLDPSLPDPTPRLPVWPIHIAGGSVGWNQADWPAIRRGGAWILHETGWRPLDEEDDPMLADPPPPPVAEAPLLVDEQGVRYYDGRQSLRVVRPDGQETVWPLPDIARGEGPVYLFAADGRLFLFNQPGRILRLLPTPTADEPFRLEATFTRGVPNTSELTRVWQDPAGRIVFAYDQNHLAIFFPAGRIPADIRLLMPAQE